MLQFCTRRRKSHFFFDSPWILTIFWWLKLLIRNASRKFPWNEKSNKFKISLSLLSIYLYNLLVCLCPIKVKTSEPIGPKFCVGPHREGFKHSKNLIKISKIYIQQTFSFIFENPRFFFKSANFFRFCLTMYTKRKCSQLK